VQCAGQASSVVYLNIVYSLQNQLLSALFAGSSSALGSSQHLKECLLHVMSCQCSDFRVLMMSSTLSREWVQLSNQMF